MIIPMTPENARITIQLTSADFEAGSFTHDVDLQKLYDNRNSCAYEFVIDYNGPQISNNYQMFYDDGTLYAAVFFPTTDGEMIKLTLTDGEGVITETEPELPAVTSSENGKVLKVVEGAWAAADAPSGLPAVSGSDNGKVLTVSSGEWVAAQPASELPEVSSSDEGYVLTVDSSGEWEAAPPSGSGFLIVTLTDTGGLQTLQYPAGQLLEAIENGNVVLFKATVAEGQYTYYSLYRADYTANGGANTYQFTTTKSTSAVFKAANAEDNPSYSR